MRKAWKELALAWVLAWGLPWMIFGILGAAKEELPQQTDASLRPQQADMYRQSVQVLTDTGVVEMELTDYLTGVLLGEIPGQFHIEAKKAQAVVARTYTLRTVLYKDKHPGGAICTDPGCCQGYQDADAYLVSGGSEAYVEQARLACLQTKGCVLTYDGALIDATYFSCSGGRTEDAVAVWGADIPYLQSVESPGEEQAQHFVDKVTFTPEQFAQALGQRLYGNPNTWIQSVTYTQGGGVDTMVIGGTAYPGTVLRNLLDLRSTVFSLTVGEDVLTVTTRGHGHRVGMSQYGAEAMAQQGYDYRQILEHYYTGAKLQAMDPSNP